MIDFKISSHNANRELNTLILSFSVLIISSKSSHDSALPSPLQDGLEFCEAEVFVTECPSDHVVVITKAEYGRMQFGRCVQRSYGSIGCVADVLVHLDSICSGRRKCELRIPDQSLDKTKPCPVDLKTYLNVSYTCLEVESGACSMCRQGGEEFALVTSQIGYLGSVISSETHFSRSCGSVKCPWRIEVSAGQTINITLMDFAMEQRGFESDERCYRYAVIKEKSHEKDAAVCGGKGRTQFIYHSVGNILEIHIVSTEVFSKLGQFVLKYEAIGCPDPEPQANAEFKRVKNYMEICCTDGQKWKVKCENNKWQGDFKVCSASLMKSSLNSYIGPLSIAVIAGIALVIAVLIVTIGVVCLKKQRNVMGQEVALYIQPDHCYGYRGQYDQSLFYADSESLMRRKQIAQQKAIYGHVTEDVGRQNFYDVPKAVEKRPLPTLPQLTTDIKKSAVEIRLETDSKSQKYQSVISSSGRFARSNGRSNVSQPLKHPLQHYTVLEPNNFRDRGTESQNHDEANEDLELLTWVTPDPCSTIYCHASSSQVGSEEGNSNTGSDSLLKEEKDDINRQDTLNKIPLRPVREGLVITHMNPPSTVPVEALPKSIFSANKSWP